MDPKALIQNGDIDAARTALVERVKHSPADLQARSLLFQVMLLCGQWDKALRQLDICTSQQAAPEMNAPVYRNLIEAEKERVAVAAMQKRPTFFPEVPDYADDFLMAMELLQDGNVEAAAKAFTTVKENLPAIQGTINGEPFDGFTETDSTLAFFIEAIEYERYLWVPITAIRELVVSKPETLIDLIWTKGRITTWEGLTMGCFLPVLYPNSFQSSDNNIRLGRLTDWKSLGGGFSRAAGQHVFQVGEEDKSLFELGEVIFKLADAQ